MTPALAERTEGAIMRPLKVLVPLIKDDLKHGDEAAQQAGMPYYQAAGEKMIEAKPQVSGSFEDWIKRNFGITRRHANRYMELARVTTIGKQSGPAGPKFQSLGDFRRRHLGEQMDRRVARREWHKPVDDIADRARRDMERIQEQELTRQQEREADQKLALRLIDIGYKVLAKELHPDKGGSRDAMARLTRVRDRLKGHA